uniref:Uncharacterized protein n=1 Tax=Populus davidiana TaxID=266767 RepID=A0A6M2EXE8_9ROSI
MVACEFMFSKSTCFPLPWYFSSMNSISLFVLDLSVSSVALVCVVGRLVCELLSSLMEFAGYGMECSGFMRGNEFPLVTSFVFLYVLYFSCNVLLFMLDNLNACPVLLIT